ncbi:hypothetical protein CYY_003770 [Polysphondylium violaceum]|uniref:Amino acid/polyamine transporter I n=1 Tax=Polysphondylium violaceum TaxID=133409 RepID=A0A8J4PYL6_9MYCE|nr:hypothetical protein CYY_003770 [Polysphondylium violaceum]
MSLLSSNDSNVDHQQITISGETPNPDDVTNNEPPRVLGLLPLIAILYFASSGGPFGIEGAIASGPPVYVLLTFILVPFLWGYPIGMITAELASLVGKNGGCSIWAEKAFGEHVSFSVGLFSFFAATVDLSLYPVLFVTYLATLFTGTRYEHSKWGGQIANQLETSYILALVIIILIVLVNIWGAEQVGNFSTVLSVILLLPFVILVCIGLWHVKLKEILSGEGGFKGRQELQMGTLIVTVAWSSCGIDAGGQIAGEVKNAKRNYPLAVIIVLLITSISYILPILVGMQYDRDWENWQDGQFSDIAYRVGGEWLNIFMSIGGMASSIGLFQCNLCTVSRNLYSLSSRGYIPKIFSKLTPKRGTPWVGIIFVGTIVALLILMPFQSILNLDMSIYGFVAMSECLTYLKLYFFNKDLERPFKAVTSPFGLPLMAAPMLFTVLIIVFSPHDIQWKTAVAVGINFSIVGIRYLYQRYKAKRKIRSEYLDYESESLIKKFSINSD